ncbi:hypothetical protein S83_026833 [Arachis hypogaea]
MNPLTLVKRIQSINSKEASLGIGEDVSWHAKYKESAYVFVGGIPFDLTEGDLLAVFAQLIIPFTLSFFTFFPLVNFNFNVHLYLVKLRYGEVVDVNLVRDKGIGKSKGFAFLAYEDQRSTNLAVDNLNGAQILGRIIRVDHVDKYKKKEEEDEETERQKREARGVCRAFQRGECTRGAFCKFSHDEQRAANTGWGQREDDTPKWGHDKFQGPKKERQSGNNQLNRIPESRDRDSRPRSHDNEKGSDSQPKRSERREEMWRRHDDDQGRENNSRRDEKRFKRHEDEDKLEGRDYNSRRDEKRSRRHEDDESEHRSREDRFRREGKRFRRSGFDDMEPEPRDHCRREDQRSTRPDDVEFDHKSRDSNAREDNRPRKQDDNEFPGQPRESRKYNDDDFAGNREERRSRKHDEEDYAPRSREDYDKKRENRSYRNDSDRSDPKGRNDFDRRDEKRSRR